MMFDKHENEFEELVDKLVKKLVEMPLEERKEKVNKVCEEYVLKYNMKPDSYQLTRLANTLLHEDLSNPDTYKVQKEEYPFHSIPQKKRRKRREFVAKDTTLDFMKFKSNENISTAPEEKM